MSKWAVPNRLTILTSFQVELHLIVLKYILYVLHFSLEDGFRLVVYFCNALGKIKRTYSQPHSHVYLYSAVNLYICIYNAVYLSVQTTQIAGECLLAGTRAK